jgi:molybdate transport system substrate-binding protein
MKRRSAILAALLLAIPGPASFAAERVLTVFAAASLTDVLEEAGSAYTKHSGVPVRFSFAASSALARQIESGAPADVFVSADQEWMDYLAGRRLVQTDTRTDVAGNSLVLVAPADSKATVRVQPGMPLAQLLGARGRLALADPATVPAGRYAKAALEKLGAWKEVADRIIAADNVRTALNFVALGEAPLGIVYATDVRGSAKVRTLAAFPVGLHEPVTYPAAVTARGGRNAQDFVRFLRSEAARAIFMAHGFTPP